MQAPSAVFEAWRREFDVLYREDRYFCLAMHPQIIGRPSRITLLEELIQYILGHPRVWLARCDEVADAVRPALRAEAPRVRLAGRVHGPSPRWGEGRVSGALRQDRCDQSQREPHPLPLPTSERE